MPPEKHRKALQHLQDAGILDAVSGILVGKPMDEVHDAEYRGILLAAADRKDLPVVWNLRIGHATPRCIIPFGVHAVFNAHKQIISFGGNGHGRAARDSNAIGADLSG